MINFIAILLIGIIIGLLINVLLEKKKFRKIYAIMQVDPQTNGYYINSLWTNPRKCAKYLATLDKEDEYFVANINNSSYDDLQNK